MVVGSIVGAMLGAFLVAIAFGHSPERARAGDVRLVADDGTTIGTVSREEALRRARATVGFDVRVPAGSGGEVATLRSVQMHELPGLPGDDEPGLRYVTLYYDLDVTGGSEPAILWIDQFQGVPPTEFADPSQWDIEILRIGPMDVTLATHLVDARVVTIAARDPSTDDGFDITTMAEYRGQALAGAGAGTGV
jgi:hypothetical protein